MKPNGQATLALVIPAYNEEGCIERTAKELINEFIGANINMELILVDNGSRDNTPKILKILEKQFTRYIKVITVNENEGFGWGVIKGLGAANAKYVGFMGADGQVSARDALKIFKVLESHDIDLCKSKRIKREDGMYRFLQSKLFNSLFYLLYHASVRDVNGTPKIMKYESYKKLDLKSKDWFIDAEILIKATSLKFKMEEIDVVFEKRCVGKSNVKATTILEFLRNLIEYRFLM